MNNGTRATGMGKNQSWTNMNTAMTLATRHGSMKQKELTIPMTHLLQQIRMAGMTPQGESCVLSTM